MGSSETSDQALPFSRLIRRADAAALLAIALLLLCSAGCQQARPEVTRRLITHQAMIDFSGLKPPEMVEPLKVSVAAPRQWSVGSLVKSALYTHQQWKSPSVHTGFGVAIIHMPLPLGQKAIMWFAKREYTKKADDGKLIGEWTDSLGRAWFEAENDKFHVRGFVVTHGFTAWIVYFGHKISYPPDPAEITLAARAVETVIPLPDMKPGDAAPTTQESADPQTAVNGEPGVQAAPGS